MANTAFRRTVDDLEISLSFSPPQELLDVGQELYRTIARRAYQLYERRDRTQGRDINDWLQAESEIIHPCHYAIAESAACMLFRLELLGTFGADQVRVSLEPRRVIVSAQREVMAEYISANGHVTKPVPQRLFHIENLPVAVDPLRSRAILSFEQLEIVMPKSMTAHPPFGCPPKTNNRFFRRLNDGFPESERL